MPQAAVTLGLTALGGVLSSRASNKATDASSRANSEALAFERQKYEEEQAQAKQQWEAREAQMAPYRAARYQFARQLASRYGINMPDMPQGPAPFPGVGADVSGGGRVGGSVPSGGTMTLAKLAGLQSEPEPIMPATPALMAPPVMTLGDLGRRT